MSDTLGRARRAPEAARRCRETLVCDALLDQNVFAGVGNIIKNEVLFRIRVHPLSTVGALPAAKLRPAGRRGAPLQLRFPRMEARLRAAQALAGAHQADLPALRMCPSEGASGQDAAAQLLLRALPEALRRRMNPRPGRERWPPAVAVLGFGRAIRHGSGGQAGGRGADNFAIPVCLARRGTAMKKARPTDHIDVHALRVGMFVHLDIGWTSHPFALSSFRITTPAQLATIRSLGIRTVRWSPEQSDLTGDSAARVLTTLPGPLPVGADAANDSGLGDPDGVDTVPYVPPGRGRRRQRGRQRGAARAGRAREEARPPARRRRAAARASTARRRAPAARRSTSSPPGRRKRAPRPRRWRARSRQDDRRAGPVHPHARRRRRRQGVDARDERRRDLAPDGPLLRLQRRGDARPRRRRDAARRRQARDAGAPAPSRGATSRPTSCAPTTSTSSTASRRRAGWAWRRARRR